MDRAVWAIIYDLPEEGRDEYMDWYHGVHIPEKLARPGYTWAAHYEVKHPGERFEKIAARLNRTDDPQLSHRERDSSRYSAGNPPVFSTTPARRN